MNLHDRLTPRTDLAWDLHATTHVQRAHTLRKAAQQLERELGSDTCSASSVMDDAAKKAEANRKRSESMKRAWATGKGTLGEKPRCEEMPCKCGCGKMPELYRLYAKGCYIPGAARIGTKNLAEWTAKQSVGLVNAHKKGLFVDVYKKRREKTLVSRPKCKCGCGKPVVKSKAIYAPGCFDATTPEKQAKARETRDWSKLSPKCEQMAEQMKMWKTTGKLDEIRLKSGNAIGMLDHLAAKVWIIRDPYGNPHKFSNLAEWARQNKHRFVDDRPESRGPFWKRISWGIIALLKKDGRSCSYRGWTAVSKLELDAGGMDLLGRDYFQQNNSTNGGIPSA